MSARSPVALAGLLAAAVLLIRSSPHRHIIRLPPGILELRSEMLLDPGTELLGARSGTVIRAAPDFEGRALIVVAGNEVSLHDLAVDGSRDALEMRAGVPPSDQPFARFTQNNGVLAEGVEGLSVERVRFRNIAGFAILASRSRRISIDRVEIIDSGSRNQAGKNNTTGGILLEEGASDFRVTHSDFRQIRGNGLWTHSLYTSPRNARGLFAWNRFAQIGRDALQAGHAIALRIEQNTGEGIGYPPDIVDAIPAAIDTAGNVERSSYAENHFAQINGKCVDLDGFHDGDVRGNVCIGVENFGIVMNNSNPDMQSRNIRVEENTVEDALYGGMFVIGTGHRIARNRLLDLNRGHCDPCAYPSDQPDMLRSGIYLGRGAERPAPARGNLVEDNEITGYKMNARCVGFAPGILPEWNVVRGNECR